VETEAIEAKLVAATESIWSLTLEWLDGLSPQAIGFLPYAEVYVSTVEITGAWEGLITLVTTERLARKIAKRIYTDPSEVITKPMVEDVLGELTNITGGVLKNSMPSGSKLGLPKLQLMTYRQWEHRNTPRILDLGYRVGYEPYLVSVCRLPKSPVVTTN
jgi:CheY-specific phosphatase CheX